MDHVKKNKKNINKPLNLKQALKGKLPPKKVEKSVRSFDTVGDIAIIEIPEELRDKEKLIGKTLLGLHKNIKVVCRKAGVHQGPFRTQKLKIIAGARRKETEYKETNVRLKLNVEKCYFSPRLSTERKRVMEQVKDKEDVMIMFSGVGPYVCVIAKNRSPKKVVGVEINPVAHNYAEENARINKLDNVELHQGDVREVVPKLGKFDRIAMPLPRSAEDFLDTALKAAKKGAVIHFYDFLHIDKFYEAKEKIKKACKSAKKQCRILRTVKCGQFGPRIYRICVDFRVM
ncbi:methyltransferase domain-containing protein [Candidatus Woesearchaeota archaeon]|nr:methyltransferase domain-containing protein [Candidatus Woesearchaeota archaeon]